VSVEQLWSLIQAGGSPVLIVGAFVALYQGYVVRKAEYDRVVHERDAWRDAFLQASTNATTLIDALAKGDH